MQRYLSINKFVMYGLCQGVTLVTEGIFLGHVRVERENTKTKTEAVELSTWTKNLPQRSGQAFFSRV